MHKEVQTDSPLRIHVSPCRESLGSLVLGSSKKFDPNIVELESRTDTFESKKMSMPKMNSKSGNTKERPLRQIRPQAMFYQEP
jgi:hypothetical protein